MSDPSVPVTRTVNDPAAVPETVRVEVPEPATLVGLRVAVKLESEGTAVRATESENPLTAVTVIVDVPDPPAVKPMVVGEAAIVKSVTVNVAVVE